MGPIDGINAELRQLEEDGQLRTLRTMNRLSHTMLKVIGFPGPGVVDFASNDYLGLSREPRVLEAAARGSKTHGAGAGASRLITGTLGCHTWAETSIAEFIGLPQGLVFATGYQVNLGVVSALAGKEDLVLADEYAHASLIDGARLGGARFSRYAHLDLDDLERRLQASSELERRRTLVLTEGLFSMDGDSLKDVRRLFDMCHEHDAILILDDAHAVGTMGVRGAGTLREHDLQNHPLVEAGALVVTGAFSKAMGSMGGFVTGSEAVIRYLINRCRPFMYSTALDPASVESAMASLRIIETDRAGITVRRLQENARSLRKMLRDIGLPVLGDEVSPILPVIVGDVSTTMKSAETLLGDGYLVAAVRPPSVPASSSRLRITVSSLHDPAQLQGLAGAIAALMPQLTEVTPAG